MGVDGLFSARQIVSGEPIMKKLPIYQSHKQVEAIKIEKMIALDNGKVRLISPKAEVFADVEAPYFMKHNPQIGGYYVRYKDGYESWSPAKAFEDGYTDISKPQPRETL